MNTRKFKCGTIVPSSCVPYSGDELAFLPEDEQPDCDANMDDIITLISDELKEIDDILDVTEYDLGCLEVDDPTLKSISQAQTLKLCALEASLEALQEQFENLDISSELITIDLGCLASAASPCQVATNTYTLIAILNVFKDAICDLMNP